VVVALGRPQQQELANLLGHPVRGAVDLRELDTALQRSRYQIGLGAVLAAGYGPLVTRRQAREQASLQWAVWAQRVGSELPDEGLVRGWFQRVAEGTSPSGRWVRRAYGADPVRAAMAVRAVGRALAALPVWRGDSELLAVFAAAVTGDPHAFDAGEPAGLLLDHALGEQFDRPADGLRPNEARALLLGRAGLQVDQVSSTVLVAHVAAATLAGVPHPMVAAMTACGGAWAVTLGEVRRWSGVRAHRNRAYVVENPPVFEWLLRRLAREVPDRRPTLICSGGFLSAASVTLLDLLVGEGAELWYGGDFDRNGLAIASWLAGRYPEQFRPWRMGPAEYQAAVAGGGKGLAPEDCEALLAVEGPLAGTARAVADGGQAAYQEQLVMMLCQDVLAAGHRGNP
jgi:uncharacterized protein (TIGR02679 family)